MVPDDTTDLADLLARVTLGDKVAFAAIYDATSAKLFGTLLRILDTRAEAEDALQDVYVKIWQKAGSYRPDRAKPMTWLISIARNHAIDRLRARGPETDGDATFDTFADPAPGPESTAIAADERTRIDRCLDRLEADRAQAVRLAYLEGHAYLDLARHFAVNLNTMRTWLRRSLISLRNCLQE
jgi:RNA polymerase sigma-70 factor (ECF subfamily)